MGLSRPLLRGIQGMGNRLPSSDTHLSQVHHCATRWPTTSSRWRAPAFLIPLISLLSFKVRALIWPPTRDGRDLALQTAKLAKLRSLSKDATLRVYVAPTSRPWSTNSTRWWRRRRPTARDGHAEPARSAPPEMDTPLRHGRHAAAAAHQGQLAGATRSRRGRHSSSLR